jgi:hypothetical protein
VWTVWVWTVWVWTVWVWTVWVWTVWTVWVWTVWVWTVWPRATRPRLRITENLSSRPERSEASVVEGPALPQSPVTRRLRFAYPPHEVVGIKCPPFVDYSCAYPFHRNLGGSKEDGV